MKRDVRQVIRSVALVAVIVCVFMSATMMRAEDWPRHRGKGDLGVWTETGIIEKIPPEGLPVRWRVPVNGGYSAPAIVDGRLFITDFTATGTNAKIGIERALALDERTGQTIWTQQWPADYTGMGQDRGPKATPTVDGDRVYVLGTGSDLVALESKTGKVLWKTNYVKDFHVPMQHWPNNWGWAAAPLVDGTKLICLVGGHPGAMVVAFDKLTGKELWRALSGEVAPSFSSPIIFEAGGVRQLIVWDVSGIGSLNPETGKVYWQIPWGQTQIGNIATPVRAGNLVFFSSYYNGAMMVKLDEKTPTASIFWKSKSDNEVVTDAVHNSMSTSHIVGDYIYGVDSYGQLRCLKLMTGERVWEFQITDRRQFASAQLIRNGDRFFINNDRGELIIAKLTPTGYQEISRTKVIKPTTPRGRMPVNWGYPGYANRTMFIRNDEELIAYSLAPKGDTQ